RHRAHRAQDHRRHLRRRRSPRRGCVLGQGPVEGRPLGRLRRPLGGQARRGCGRGAPVRDPGGVRHRRGPPGVGVGRDVRHRAGRTSQDRAGGERGVRPAAGGDHPRPRPAPPDLPAHGGLRPLRAGRQGVHLGAPEQARPNEERARGVRVVRVLPDGPIDKTFDYTVPASMDAQVRVGTLVRVELHGRRVRAWVVADGVEPPPGVQLRDIAKVTGRGPSEDVVELAQWGAWRWAGRPAQLLGTASPPVAVRELPAARPRTRTAPTNELAAEALGRPRSVVRLGPAGDRYPLLVAVASACDALVLTQSVESAARLAGRLRRDGVPVALMPRDWAAAASGGHAVIGTRAAAWAPAPTLGAVVVLDAHDEVYQEERAPTWSAWVVAAERAARAGVPCVLVTPCPTPDH